MKISGANQIYFYNSPPTKGDDDLYHFIYRLEKISSGKFYLGLHSTKSLQDNYIGSSSILKKYITKNNLSEFKFICLEFFKSRELALSKEKELVSSDFIKSSSSYNLKIGGEGGGSTSAWEASKKALVFKHKNDPIFRQKALTHLDSIRMSGAIALKKKIDTDPEYKKIHSSNSRKNALHLNSILKERFKDKDFKESFSKKASQPLDKHPLWGKTWIYNNVLGIRKLVYKSEVLDFIKDDWVHKRGPNKPKSKQN